jgi:hypothetical protein
MKIGQPKLFEKKEMIEWTLVLKHFKVFLYIAASLGISNRCQVVSKPTAPIFNGNDEADYWNKECSNNCDDPKRFLVSILHSPYES